MIDGKKTNDGTTHQLVELFVPYLATGTQKFCWNTSARLGTYAGWEQIQDQDLIIQNMKGNEVVFLLQ